MIAAMITLLQQKFIAEYCKTLAEGKPHATQAAIKAGVPKAGAHVTASRWLSDPKISAAIESYKLDVAARAEISTAAVLRRWWELANADPNELMQIRRDNCRHCWGLGHRYQWTEGEYLGAVESAISRSKEAPDGMGGFGFNLNREPNPECPECFGDGMESLHITDTRKLKGSARLLYAGVQKTKDGIKILTRDQDAALLHVARYIGMTTERREITGADGAPIAIANLKAEDLTDDQLAALIASAEANTSADPT